MTDLKFKKLIENHIKNKLNKLFENECFETFKDKYIIQDNKYNIPTNTTNNIFNIDSIDEENSTITVINVNNLQFPLSNKKIFVNYNNEIDVKVFEDNKIKIEDKDDIYLLALGDIVTDNVDKQENKIYIIVDVDNVRVETETISDKYNNTYYDVNIFVGSNDYIITHKEFEFFYEELIRIFSEQSFNITFNEKNLDIFTVNKPRYRCGVKNENDRVGYIILRFSHFYNNNTRI
jgi:hypothetical protein|nr:MAG TPA: hypothetical protein [Herelleviridae sp.]